MPSKKQPKSLSELCTRRVANIAEDAYKAIEVLHGGYENSNCRREIGVLRNFFLENLGHMFEIVCEEISRSNHKFPKDHRILVEFISHEMKQILRLPRGLTSMYITASFLGEKLGTMKRITTLHIYHIPCTDAMIAAISDNCANLEQLHIHTKYVTDEGLLVLRKCSKLLIINDLALRYTISRVSQNTIKLLVAGLPRLLDISYPCMGAVLSSGFENVTLPLRSVNEEEAELKHVEAIVKLCPELTQLTLKKKRSSSDDILNPLIISNLKVFNLGLAYFATAHVAPLLHEKGQYLRTLAIQDPRTYNTKEDITLIGVNCPFLEHFTWTTYYGDNVQIDVDHPYQMSKQEEHRIFVNLETLKLDINVSDYNLGIPQLCLLNALNIKNVILIVNDLNGTCNDFHLTLTEILLKNTMTSLSYLYIHNRKNCLMSCKATLEVIFNELHNLKHFYYVSQLSAEVVDCFKFMDAQILENNLNLLLQWEDVDDDDED